MKPFKSTQLALACLLLSFGRITNASADTPTPAPAASNPATTHAPRAATPVPKTEKQGWMEQHDNNAAQARKGGIELLFIGDSITRCWSREGREVWAAHYTNKLAANFGISGDCTEHVLWRIQNGELENIQPKAIVLLIGTNNITQHDSPADIAQAVGAIVGEMRHRSPASRILLLGVLPRGEFANHRDRMTIREINRLLSHLHDGNHVTYLDFGGKLLQPDGSMSKEVTKDFTHLTAKGYEIFADAIGPALAPLLAKPQVPASFAEVAYGPLPGQNLDFWQAKSGKPAPLIMNIHGGGWRHGPKEALGRDQRYLDQGISVAHITYRFTPANPLPAPVMDSARALQFLRSKAAEWNIDPSRVIVTGFSAGGCSALWLATHDDLANPSAADPVERQSTRVSGAMVGGAQTTIEPEKVRNRVGEAALNHPMLCNAGGFKNNEEMLKAIVEKPSVAKLYQEFSPINHLSSDDPPMLLEYGKLAPEKQGDIHGNAFGVEFKKEAEARGLKHCYLRVDKDDIFTGFPGGQKKFIEMIFNLNNPSR